MGQSQTCGLQMLCWPRMGTSGGTEFLEVTVSITLAPSPQGAQSSLVGHPTIPCRRADLRTCDVQGGTYRPPPLHAGGWPVSPKSYNEPLVCWVQSCLLPPRPGLSQVMQPSLWACSVMAMTSQMVEQGAAGTLGRSVLLTYLCPQGHLLYGPK